MRINLSPLSRLNYRRIGYIAAIGSVTAVAARVSYSHILDVTLIAGQPADVAVILPLAIDGMLGAASLAMAEDKANGRKPRGWARFGFWFGAGISLACNVASTVVHTTVPALLPLAIFISALAPALLLITVEIMARPGKPVDAPVEEPVEEPVDEEELGRRAAEEAKAAKAAKAAEARRVRELVRAEMAKLETAAVMPVSPPPAAPMAQGIHVPTAAEIAALVA